MFLKNKKYFILPSFLLIAVVLFSGCSKKDTLGKFIKAAKLNHTRYSHTATLLNDGNVLITGGYHYFKYLNSAELYLTEENRFIKVGNLNVGRAHHSAHLLKDGKVIIIGGMLNHKEEKENKHNIVELYDPKTRKFKIIYKLLQPVSQPETIQMRDGRIFIYGGRSKDGNHSGFAEIYDPEANTSKLTSKFNHRRSSYSLTLLEDGRILIIGGGVSSLGNGKLDKTLKPFMSHGVKCIGGATDLVEIYDPKTDKFEFASNLNMRRGAHSAIHLEDGNVLIVGGSSPDKGVAEESLVSKAEIYDPVKNKFTIIQKTKDKYVEPVLTELKSGNVLITGGWKDNVEIFDYKKRSFIKAPEINIKREKHTVTKLENNKFLVVGGRYKGSKKPIMSEIFSESK